MARAEFARRPRCRIEICFKLGNEVLQAVDLMRQFDGVLLFGGECLLGACLFFLTGVDQHVEAQLLGRQLIEILR